MWRSGDSPEEDFVEVVWFMMGLKGVFRTGHRAEEVRVSSKDTIMNSKEQFIIKVCTLLVTQD